MINLQSINSWIFLLCNIVLLFKERYIVNKAGSLIVTLVCVAGIISAVYKSTIRPASKALIIILYMVYLIIYFILGR